MKKKYHNKKTSLIIALIYLGFIYFSTLLIPIKSIECSKINKSCLIYSKSVLLRTPKLVNKFDFSEIDYHKIKTNYHNKRLIGYYHSYEINIYLKSGQIIKIDNESRSYERAEKIYNEMINNDNFILKGSYWKSFLNNY